MHGNRISILAQYCKPLELDKGLVLIPSWRAFHIHGGFFDVVATGRRFHPV